MFEIEFKGKSFLTSQGGGTAQLRIGYMPSGFLSLKMTQDFWNDKKGLHVFLIPSLFGDIRFYQHQMDLKHGASYSSSLNTFGGIGVGKAFPIGKRTLLELETAVQFIQGGVLLPDEYFGGENEDGLRGDEVIYRESSNSLTGYGLAYSGKVKLEVLKRFLFELRAERWDLKQNGYLGYRFYNEEGEAFAEMVVKDNGKIRFVVWGDYFIRKSNMTDFGTPAKYKGRAVGVGIRF
jgi:hypothetical protein